MLSLELILTFLILLLGLRTLLWHLQSWQLREYRLDRMRAWLRTDDGKAQFFMPWFYPGLLPRPRLSLRVLLIILLVLGLSLVLYVTFHLAGLSLFAACALVTLPPESSCFVPSWIHIVALLLVERTLWLQTGLAVLISNLPVRLKKLHLFAQARQVIQNGDPNIVRIGITGSYGKSSTKELLVHLLKSEFGEEAVLYNPANENTEVAIARLILNNRSFFAKKPKSQKPNSKNRQSSIVNRKFLVIETGAYKKGEIGTVANMIQCQYGIITGLNQQHVELFGSIKNTREAKFELAEGTHDTVFFNGDNAYLQEIFNDRQIKATSVPISFKAAQNVVSLPDRSEFEAYGQKFTLPWPGQFFVHNALLALELCRELDIAPKKLAQHLKALAPLKRALTSTKHPQGFTVLRDLHSANPDGVLGAIEHLRHFKGKRIFVSIPLRELAGHAPTVHAQIFEKLKDLGAEVYWEKTDFADLGKEILGDQFHPLDKAGWEKFSATVKTLGEDDVVLLESKLSQKVLDFF